MCLYWLGSAEYIFSQGSGQAQSLNPDKSDASRCTTGTSHLLSEPGYYYAGQYWTAIPGG